MKMKNEKDLKMYYENKLKEKARLGILKWIFFLSSLMFLFLIVLNYAAKADPKCGLDRGGNEFLTYVELQTEKSFEHEIMLYDRREIVLFFERFQEVFGADTKKLRENLDIVSVSFSYSPVYGFYSFLFDEKTCYFDYARFRNRESYETGKRLAREAMVKAGVKDG